MKSSLRTIKTHFLLLLSALVVPSKTMASDTLFIDNHTAFEVVSHLLYIEASSSTLTADSAAKMFDAGLGKKTHAIKTFNAGVTRSAFWFRLVITNVTDSFRQLIMGVHARVDTLHLYERHDGVMELVTETGFMYNYATRQIPNRNFLFRENLAPGATRVLYIMAHNSKYLYVPFALKDAETYMVSETRKYQLLSVYIGIFLFVIAFNLFMLVSMKDKLHLWYGLYIFVALVYLMMEDGITYEFGLRFLPDLRLLLDEELWWYGLMALWIYVMQLFTGQSRKNSIFYIPSKIAIGILCAVVALSLCIDITGKTLSSAADQVVFRIADIVFITGEVLIVAGLTEKIWQGSRPAILYLVATGFGLFGTTNIYLNYTGFTNINIVEPNGMLVGLTIEVIILSIALSARYNRLRQDKLVLLTEITQQQEKLTRRIVDAQEQERKRLAEDLHDDVGATLGALQLHITNRPTQPLNEAALKRYLEKAITLSSKAAADIRAVSHDLLPKDFVTLGLFNIVKDRIEVLNATGSTHYELITEGNDALLSDINAITVYRIINELLSNIAKHAQAAQSTVQILLMKDELEIIVEDDGIGFNNAIDKKGIGLQNIRSRLTFLKGTIYTDSSESGTTIVINIPV